MIVIGDKKTPLNWRCGSARFYPANAHGLAQLSNTISHTMPYNHYAMKNSGYLEAMRLGADCIYDTDDDNIPEANWSNRTESIECEVVEERGWCNAYRYFNGTHIWPRGFPLNLIYSKKEPVVSKNKRIKVSSPIQQGMVNGNPDVDAIWRLVLNKEVVFDNPWSVALTKHVWCPFNSQSTWWFKDAFPLLYLPIHATFRMTDIWRSFVAQRCLWEIDRMVSFHSPAEVFQERNPHSLIKDFESEIPGYLHNEDIAKSLEKTKLKRGKKWILKNLQLCYETLVIDGFLPKAEIVSLNAWVNCFKTIGQ